MDIFSLSFWYYSCNSFSDPPPFVSRRQELIVTNFCINVCFSEWCSFYLKFIIMSFLSIFLAIVALAAGVAAYLQYLKNPAHKVAEAGREGGSDEDHAVGETVYQGLLWMKHKYEEER